VRLAPGTRLGPYEIVSRLGAGGMGEVYKARDTRLDRPVAVKILAPDIASSPQARQRFEREARTSLAEPGEYQRPRASPDGQRVAFDRLLNRGLRCLDGGLGSIGRCSSTPTTVRLLKSSGRTS
jgi:serine/threonine protein kinase